MNVEGKSLYTGSTPQNDRSDERIDVDLPATGELSPSSRTRTKSTKIGRKSQRTSPKSSPPLNPQPQSSPAQIIETSEGSANEQHGKRPLRRITAIETDYYKKPTLLSRLVQNQKYANAIKRLYKHPDEACVWVCAKRIEGQRSSSKSAHEIAGFIYSIRQLPIHIACNNLIRTHDFHMRKLLNELISTLVVMFPEGAHEKDHRNRLPLSDAVWYGADPDTIALFLMAKPEALKVKDEKGRSLMELNRYRTGNGNESIRHMLGRGVEYWTKAQAKATVCLKNDDLSFPGMIKCISMIASTSTEDESIMTTLSQHPEVEPEEIPSICWEQLEQRCTATEQILTKINERNYELSKHIEALITIDQAQGFQLVKDLTKLSVENTMLSDKLHGLETLLLNFLSTGDEKQDQERRLALTEISSLMGSWGKSSCSGSRQPILRVTREAKALHKELSQKQAEQRKKIRKLHCVVEGLMEEDDDKGDEDEPVYFGARCTISTLTSRSYYSESSLAPRRQTSNRSIVDLTPPLTQTIDDLELILKHAAAKDLARRLARDPPSLKQDGNSEDLSAILRWAASNDSIGAKRTRLPSVTSSWSPPSANGALHTSLQKKSPHERDLQLPALPAGSRQEQIGDVGMERMGWIMVETK